MYQKILIANRSDCASRLMHTCRKLGIRSVLCLARDDSASLPQKEADETVFTGFSRDAYTNADNILQAARQTHCEAILPGWGFLSEDFRFARRANLMGIHCLAPSPAHLMVFGDKWQTLAWLSQYLSLPHAAAACDDLCIHEKMRCMPGPWMLKGKFGGGGKNIQKITAFDDLLQKVDRIIRYENPQHYYIEPCIENARHIEFQMLGNGRGAARCIGARDCTLQFQNQKWLEFSYPCAPHKTAGKLARQLETAFSQIRYKGLATAEFLFDANGAPHLLEVNPRLQVEHGVTEMACGIDIVQWLIECFCYGAPEFPQTAAPPNDAAEFRLFARSAGTLKNIGFDGFPWPDHPMASNPDYRLETGYLPGDGISGAYDGLIARFIVRAPHNALIARLKNWLSTFHCDGLQTNLGDLYNCQSLQNFS